MKLTLLFLFVLLVNSAIAQLPTDYYKEAQNKKAYELKTALHNIIKDHSAQSYSSLWDFYKTYELDNYYENDGSILDIYSENPNGTDPYNFVKSSDQCGGSGYKVEGDCYNREHSMPQSWFKKDRPMVSDVHHIFASDGKVNSYRGNYPFGIVGSATKTTKNGSKLGNSSANLGYSGTVFEPIDEFKGDIARAYFYMATRYENKVASWENNMNSADAVFNGTSDQVFENWVLDMLLAWHKQDPISQKEIDRNNAAFTFQGNRNPFVDNPGYVDCIWKNECNNLPVVNKDSCPVVKFAHSSQNPTWYETIFEGDTSMAKEYYVYRLVGDTVLAGKEQSKLMKLDNPSSCLCLAEYQGAMYSDSCGKTFYTPAQGKEYLLYDFSKNVGDTIFSEFMKDEIGQNYYVISKIDTITLDGIEKRRRFKINALAYSGTWIEGVGSIHGLLQPVAKTFIKCRLNDNIKKCETSTLLTCHYQSNKFIYKGWNKDCFYKLPSAQNIRHNTKLQYKIYPNPATEYVFVENTQGNPTKIAFHTILGQKALELETSNAEIHIPVHKLSPGQYIVSIIEKNSNTNSYRSNLTIVHQ